MMIKPQHIRVHPVTASTSLPGQGAGHKYVHLAGEFYFESAAVVGHHDRADLTTAEQQRLARF